MPYNKWCTYVHITRELFHAWKKRWHLLQAFHILDKIFLKDRSLLLFLFCTHFLLIIWFPHLFCLQGKNVLATTRGAWCSLWQFQLFCQYKDILVIIVFFVSVVSMGLAPWMCSILRLWHVEVSGHDGQKEREREEGKKERKEEGRGRNGEWEENLGLNELTKISWQVVYCCYCGYWLFRIL